MTKAQYKSRPRRWMYSLDSQYSTLSDFGRLFPICFEPVIPGDTFYGSVSQLIRFSPLNKALLENIYVDMIATFTPYRLSDRDWETTYQNR